MATAVAIGAAWQATGVHCACAGCWGNDENNGGISYDVGVVQGKGVMPLLNTVTGEVDYIDWLDDDGVPYLNVVYMCAPTNTETEEFMALHHNEYMHECFDDLLIDICDVVEQEDSMHNEAELLNCDCCLSSIVSAEPVILFTHGTFIVPDRCPPGATPVRFEPDARLNEHVVCLRCARAANMVREPPIWTGRLYDVRIDWHEE